MEKVQLNDLSLAYRRHGTGAPLLLVHGFPLDGSAWETLAGHLGADFDVIMPDLRGFGQSDAPEGDYSIKDMASDLAQLLDVLGIEKTYIAGHSMGGYVALAFGHAYPERVLGLGLLGSQTDPDSQERSAGRLATAGQVSLEGVDVVAGMAEKLSANPEFVPYFRGIILRQPAAGVIGALKAMAGREDAASFMAEFKFPVVIVHGLADMLIPVERAREIKARLPGADLSELPGVGHSPQLEAPVETARCLLKLLDR